MKNLHNEIGEKTAEVITDDLKEMTMPTAKSIGKNMGLLIDGIFGWTGTWGEIQKIKQNQYIKEFKEDLKTRLDAKVLSIFRYNSTYPTAELEVVDNDGLITPYRYILFDFKNKKEEFDINEELNLLTTIDNLIRLGIIIKNKSILELKYDYNNFKNHTFYKIVDKEKDTNSRIQILNSRIELTNMGRKFLNICIM